MRLLLAALVVVVAARDAHSDPAPPGVSAEVWHIAELATATHRQAYKDNDTAKYLRAHALYQEYLAKAPDDAEASLTFYDAELLWKLERYDEAAKMYGRALELAPHGRRLIETGYAFVLSTMNATAAEIPDGGASCNDPDPCPISPGIQRRLNAFERYLTFIHTGEEVVHIEFRRASTYYEYHHYAEAAPLFDGIVARYPQHELAAYAVSRELDCWHMLHRYDELRAAIARFKKSAIWNDAKVREQIEQIETALKNKL